MFIKNISYIKNTKKLFESNSQVLEYQKEIKNGGLIVIKNLFEKKKLIN